MCPSGSVSPADGGTTDPEAEREKAIARSWLRHWAVGITTNPPSREACASVLAEFDRQGAELEAARASWQHWLGVANEARAELASTRRELSESLVARARLDGQTPSPPEPLGVLASTCLIAEACEYEDSGIADPRGTATYLASWLDAADYWVVPKSAALARSVPSVTAQTEEPRTDA